MKKGLLAVIGLVLVIMVTACDEGSSNEQEAQDIKEMIHNYSVGNYDNVSASITSQELIVTDSDNNKTAYDLPEDEFFVSIAPFIKTTHSCEIHSLTGCQGELIEKEFQVHIEDEEGNIVVDKTMSSLQNGFIDMWLPRNKSFRVKIEQNGKTAEAKISTFKEDKTCITTMQLI